jgi:hypothetical protein
MFCDSSSPVPMGSASLFKETTVSRVNELGIFVFSAFYCCDFAKILSISIFSKFDAIPAEIQPQTLLCEALVGKLCRNAL